MQSSTETPKRLYDRIFVFAFLSQVGFVIANCLVLTHYARWVSFLGGDVREVGAVLGLGSVASLVLRPWIGQWINRIGARNTWLLGYGVYAIGCLSNLLVDGLGWELYVLRTLLVLGPALVFASTLTFTSQRAPEHRRTEAIGTMGMAGFIGIFTGSCLGDVILVGHDRQWSDFALLFGGAAGALVIPALLLLLVPSEPSPREYRSLRIIDFARTSSKHWPGMILLVIGAFGLCMSVPFGFLSKFVDAAHIETTGVSSVVLFFLGYSGCGLFLRVVLRRVPDRFGRRKVLLAGLVILGSGMISLSTIDASNANWLLLSGVLCGGGHSLMFHTMMSLALEKFPHAVRGTGSALTLMVIDFGMFAGPPLLAEVAHHLDYRGLFLTVASSCFLAAIGYTWVSVPIWRARRSGGVRK